MCEARVVRIVFMRINFPGWDKLMNFHESILLAVFVIMSLKRDVDLPSTSIGQPKYEPILSLFVTPRGFLISFINFGGVFGLKTTCDFSKLIFSPDFSQKVARAFLIAHQFFGFALKKNKASSAKKGGNFLGRFLQS